MISIMTDWRGGSGHRVQGTRHRGLRAYVHTCMRNPGRSSCSLWLLVPGAIALRPRYVLCTGAYACVKRKR